ncbi:MAG: hypothetical protein N3C60_08025 [Calditerrivibrio sp.]|nr:hypothetical protein [Calditerrivibrio sp.]
MKGKVFFLFFFLLICMVYTYADTQQLIAKSKTKIENLEKLKGARDNTKIAVAGVKAEEQVSKDELYWAGKDEVGDEELELFKSALNYLEKGDIVNGREVLSNLLTKYPKSALAEDSLALINELKKK